MRLFSTDIDGTVYDGPESARKFFDYWSHLRDSDDPPLLVFNTGRSLADTRDLIRSSGLPEPDYLICGVGTEMFDMRRGMELPQWFKELATDWDFDLVSTHMARHPAANPQPPECQNPFKSSWFWRQAEHRALDSIITELEQQGVRAQAIYSSERDLDLLPLGANKGNALRWLCGRLDIDLAAVVVAGDSGNDETMFALPGVTGIVVANAEESLVRHLGNRITFRASHPCADGVIEGLGKLAKTEILPHVHPDPPQGSNTGFYIVHISIHGLIRGHDLELGRDADTGGQCTYVLELVNGLARHPRVGKVDLLTRQVVDPKVSADYAQPVEELGHGAAIKRIPAGPHRYLRKEVLWRYLDVFVDQCLALFRRERRLPDIIHAHYADAGYVGRQLSTLLGCPFIFTGHSLGRTKIRRLIESGTDPEKAEQHYNFKTRVEAEELSLDAASLVVTSTRQEVDDQYAAYDHHQPGRMRVLPPGVDIGRFEPPDKAAVPESVRAKVGRFLKNPERPLVMALARADEKKNLVTLVRAFGESRTLREQANLLIVAGNRDHVADLNPGARKVWGEILRLIDDYDLYGIAAIPKHHDPEEVPGFYRLAASTGGLFVNPALTEPFGLTIIEAAASGLPVLATNCGGPNDILANCGNGILFDPTDQAGLTAALEDALADRDRWQRWSRSGLAGVHRHYTWKNHVEKYLEEASGLLDQITRPQLITDKIRSALPLEDRIIFSGLAERLQDGDREAIDELRELIIQHEPGLGFGICSGRSLQQARSIVDDLDLPRPDLYITQLGGEIHYSARYVADDAWTRHLRFRWNPVAVRDALGDVSGLRLQTGAGSQHEFKISYDYDPAEAPTRAQIQRQLRKLGLPAKVLLSSKRWLDVIPLRSGKGQAIRYVAMRWGLPADKVLVYARRGTDYEALSGQYLAVLAGDHAPELKPSSKLPRVYLAERPNFAGLIEGIRAYHFDSVVRVPESAGGMDPDVAHHDAVLAPDFTATDTEQE